VKVSGEQEICNSISTEFPVRIIKLNSYIINTCIGLIQTVRFNPRFQLLNIFYLSFAHFGLVVQCPPVRTERLGGDS
jgi:hypothetical protein